MWEKKFTALVVEVTMVAYNFTYLCCIQYPRINILDVFAGVWNIYHIKQLTAQILWEQKSFKVHYSVFNCLKKWRLCFCNSCTFSTWWTTISQSSVKLPAARISTASKTCQALLSKWAQAHLKEESPGAAAYRLIETPVEKSLIFHPYSLNISLWGAVLLCVELLRHGGQTTKQLSAVVKRLGNQQRKPHPIRMKQTIKKRKIGTAEPVLDTFWYKKDSYVSFSSSLWAVFSIHVQTLA